MIMRNFLKRKVKKYFDRVYIYFQKKDRELVEDRKNRIIGKFKSVGTSFKLNGNNHFISKPENVLIGNNVHIGDNFYAKSEGGIIIGHNTHISRNVTIYSENHNYNGSVLPYDNTTVYKPVIIEDNVWIGMNVSIVPGIRIGEGAIIGLGTVVNRNVEPLEIVGSAKTVTIKTRNKVHYQELLRNCAFGGVNGNPLKEIELSTYRKTYSEQRKKPIVFVLGTGRSGSTSITNILNQHSNCVAYHEDITQLIRLSTEIANHSMSDAYKYEIDSIFNYKIWEAKEGELLVHSDQRFWNLINVFAIYFPNAKFVHLIREPIDCIKSMVLRDWYEVDEYPKIYSHDWAKYRLQGDEVGAVSTRVWSEMNNIQKCTWYYFYINNNISKQLKELPVEKYFSVALDKLDENKNDLLEFMGLEIEPLTIRKSNEIRKSDLDKLNTIDIELIEKQILLESKKYDLIF